ncbi:MAG: ABC transporter substrate-binding protein [Dehalococcoidia bacterium]|nr:ABC transporter substrate-binding protein [Dehalococcoidia bacterium]
MIAGSSNANNLHFLSTFLSRYVASLLPALAAGILLGMVACTSPVPTPSPTSTPTPPAKAYQSSAVIASPVAAPHLDVHQDVSEALLSLGPGIVYSRLMRLRSGPDVTLPSMALECDLCSRWEHPDPLTYVFHLRQGVRWQDIPPVNGRALIAKDVVFSLDRMRTPGWPGAALLQGVASIKATDALTVTIRLRYPDADFLLALANGQSKVVAPEAVAVKGHLREGPTIGTGPWVMKENGGEGVVLEANPRYYEPGLPGLQQLRILPIPDQSTRLSALLIGRLDMTPVDADGWAQLQGFGAKVSIGEFPQPGAGVLLALKATAPPFDRADVRQALFQAIDPWRTLESVWKGQGDVAVGIPAASTDWLLPRDEMQRYLRNPAQVKELLSRAGVQPPVAFTLTVADFGDRYLAQGQEYARMLETSGFQATVKEVNPRVYAEEVWDKGEFQAFLGPMPPVATSNAFLLGLLHSRGRWSVTGYADAELDRMIEAQSVAEQGRGELILDIQRYVLDRGIMFMPVTGTRLWAWQGRVEGFAPNFAAAEYFHWARLRVRQG